MIILYRCSVPLCRVCGQGRDFLLCPNLVFRCYGAVRRMVSYIRFWCWTLRILSSLVQDLIEVRWFEALFEGICNSHAQQVFILGSLSRAFIFDA